MRVQRGAGISCALRELPRTRVRLPRMCQHGASRGGHAARIRDIHVLSPAGLKKTRKAACFKCLARQKRFPP
ncbi:hypothetical protein BRPE64_ACDS12860 [Caballeronia insecticola]|uniref:Uncharacterized protein n=1 Tax=Caballeronia insecticola TaxID=758793 RepID=R4WQ56_9BURK|nr:hypothetical protein BRPE64_ACDS12860 [Caballeronia insecticola]